MFPFLLDMGDGRATSVNICHFPCRSPFFLASIACTDVHLCVPTCVMVAPQVFLSAQHSRYQREPCVHLHDLGMQCTPPEFSNGYVLSMCTGCSRGDGGEGISGWDYEVGNVSLYASHLSLFMRNTGRSIVKPDLNKLISTTVKDWHKCTSHPPYGNRRTTGFQKKETAYI